MIRDHRSVSLLPFFFGYLTFVIGIHVIHKFSPFCAGNKNAHIVAISGSSVHRQTRPGGRFFRQRAFR